jgi:integrase
MCLSTSHQVEVPETPEEFFGSWRVARRDLVIDLVKELLVGLREPNSHEPDLPKRLAAHNARVRMAVIGLGLLSGVRKREIVLLRRQDVDLEDGWIAIRGKPHCHRPAYRRLPLLLEMMTLISRIHPQAEMATHPRRKLFTLFDQNGQPRDLTPSGIEEMLQFMGGRMGVTLMPDFYGLRHRFRSDWLAKGVATAAIDFLMGHESVGMEAHSIYRDSRIEGLRETYHAVAGELGREYGWVEDVP